MGRPMGDRDGRIVRPGTRPHRAASVHAGRTGPMPTVLAPALDGGRAGTRKAPRDWRIAMVAVGAGLIILAIGAVVVIVIDPFGGRGPDGSTQEGTEALGVAAAQSSAPSIGASATPSTEASGRPTPSPANNPPPASYPGTVDGYAQAALSAWLARDNTRLGQLGVPIAVNEMGQAPVGLPGGWEFFGCWNEPFSPCRQLRNDRGDIFSVSVDPMKLAQPKAIARAFVDINAYPPSALEYVKYTLDAWSASNTERVADLIAGSSASWFFSRPPVQGGRNGFRNYVQYTSGAGNTCVQAEVDSPQSASFSWQLNPSRLGQAHALIWVGYGYDDPSGIC